jgi:hypothetical protein
MWAVNRSFVKKYSEKKVLEVLMLNICMILILNFVLN